MTKLILNPECKLYVFNDKSVYSSRQVAEEFRKQHFHVLRSVDDITESKIGLSEDVMKLLAGQTIEEFCKENYFEDTYKDASGKKNRHVLMTQKGAMLIVMGFTGAKATAVKIGLLNRFEAMSIFIRYLQSAKMEHPAFTQAITDSKENPKSHHYINETNMINRIVLGVEAKKFRTENGIKKGDSIRPYLTMEQIKGVEALQRIDIGLLIGGTQYEDRKRILTLQYQRMNVKKIAA